MIKGGVTAFGRFNLAYYAAQKDPWPTQASPNAITNNRQNLPLSCKLAYFTDQWILSELYVWYTLRNHNFYN